MTTTSYRDHLALRHRGPIDMTRPRVRPGDVILGNSVQPTYVHGEPIVTLPFVQHDGAPEIDTVGSALSRAGWEDWLAVLVFAAGAVVLVVAWAMVS